MSLQCNWKCFWKFFHSSLIEFKIALKIVIYTKYIMEEKNEINEVAM